MTRLTYVVGGCEVITYREALNLAATLNAPITRRYTPIEEPDPQLTEKQRARRIKL